ncbi:MAG: glycosyltransferase family 9 protein, partial [Mesorhizobium sp.]
MLQISPAPFHSILVVQTKFIGDLVLASALAKNLRLAFPGASIVFLCEARFESFVIAHDIASEVVTFRRDRMRGTSLERGKELYAMVQALRRFRFDLTIDLTDSKTSRIVTGLVNAKTRVGY